MQVIEKYGALGVIRARDILVQSRKSRNQPIRNQPIIAAAGRLSPPPLTDASGGSSICAKSSNLAPRGAIREPRPNP